MNHRQSALAIKKGNRSEPCRSTIGIAKLLSLALDPTDPVRALICRVRNGEKIQSAELNRICYAIRAGRVTPKLLGAQESENTTLQRSSLPQASDRPPGYAVEFSFTCRRIFRQNLALVSQPHKKEPPCNEPPSHFFSFSCSAQLLMLNSVGKDAPAQRPRSRTVRRTYRRSPIARLKVVVRRAATTLS